jgi:uncharacterized protein (DUF983 family)
VSAQNTILSVIMGAFRQDCPQCHKGHMFKYPLRQFWRFSTMNEQCEHCSCDFEPETGFYYGAMYISYALNVILFAITFVSIRVFTGSEEPLSYIIPVIALILLFFPFNFRLSRGLMLHIFGPRQKGRKA